MTRRLEYRDAAGNAVSADEALDDRGILRSGYSTTIPLLMMDSMQKDVGKHFGDRRRVTERDPMGRLKATFTEEPDEDDDEDRKDNAMNTNDECIFVDSRGITFVDHRIADTRRALERLEAQQEELRKLYRDGATARQEAHEDMKREMSSAWRHDAAPAGAYPYSAAAEGGPCTVDGQPGVLTREGNYLVCKPTRQDAQPVYDGPTYDAAEGLRRKQEAYDAMIKEMSEAWRGGK